MATRGETRRSHAETAIPSQISSITASQEYQYRPVRSSRAPHAARSSFFVPVGEIPARQWMQVLSCDAQTLVTSCANRYGRRSDVPVEPAGLALHSGITSKIGVSRCEQPHVVRR